MQNADNDNIIDDNEANLSTKKLSPAAKRALQEAEDRRKAKQDLELPPETGGRGGAEPVRFGDYEINGRAIDF
ncbi:DUF1674 domain-containing protein [Agrobacterium sp.]|jgi:hypothetical protein|uniref:DUF1674 domain-containing protein n=1 Tax=Agrobacterium sp. TaxID=361 RepID=UPI0028AF6237|nr:DUF1674 domain-containing protein [Agrobacterium sp.]